MKKTKFLMALALALSLSGFASAQSGLSPDSMTKTGQDAGGNQDAFFQIKFLLDNNKIFDCQDEVAALSPSLDVSQKVGLFESYKKNGVGPFFLNFIPFGVGSWVQGDIVSGVVISSVELISIAMIVVGTIYEAMPEESRPPHAVGLWSSVIGRITLGGAAIYALISPWVYSSKWNKALNFALNSNTASLTVIPLIDPLQNEYGIAARLSI